MIIAILQARVSSSRLPGKVLQPILGVPMLLRQIERVGRSKKIDRLLLATSLDASDDPIEALCRQNKIDCFRGNLEDVLDRFYQASLPLRPDHVVRLTGDCPLADPELIDRMIRFHLEGGFDYTSNHPPTFPDGLDVEVFRASCLTEAWQEAKLPSEREHVTPFIVGNPERYRLGSLKNDQDLSGLRWTVDEKEDFALVSHIYEELYPRNKNFSMTDVLNLLERRPELKNMNTKYQRNEGYKKSLKKDSDGSKSRYAQSEKLLERALKTIPLGTQTFSKSKTQFPLGVSPYFITRGEGSHVWDADGNEYVDFINSLAAITLGYNDPDVTAAVRAQLEEGVIFSLPHPIEIQVAEKIVEMVPCAEMVRFGKNGSDATAGAIRLARAFTRRDHVAVCGYHGWQDWYIGSTTRHLGVPQATRDLTHTFFYNDLESLRELFKKYPDQIAGVILEPMSGIEPAPGFLEGVQEIARKKGAVLIFDETVTGFRFANGGAQEYFGVIPDLATFGKGMANGYPISAVVGRADIMKLMEEIFFSFTFGGETLSLAASLATLNKLQKLPVVDTLRKQGSKIIAGTKRLIEKYKMENILSIGGNPTLSSLTFKESPPYVAFDLKTLFLQEVLSRGILTLGAHNMNYAHHDAEIDRLIAVYAEIFPILKEAVEKKSLHQQLRCEPLRPLFKIR
jgi:glutamate-1-semialdehyde aminotransferase/spore coat polysaccharide biosynthesis protein SpsF (cytidylyltransferase family)